MPMHHVTDFEQPDRMPPALRRQVLDEVRARIAALEADSGGNLHRRDVLEAIDDDGRTA